MSVVLIAGAETLDNSELNGVFNGFTISTTVKRSGGASYRANPTTTATRYALIGGAVSATGFHGNMDVATATFRFCLRIDTLPASGSEEFFVAADTALAGKMHLRLTSAGKVQAYASNGTTQLGTDSTASLATATWYCIEVQVGTGATAPWEVRIRDNAGALLDTMSSTGNLGTVNNGKFYLGKVNNRSGQTVDFYFDDVLARDDSTWPGIGSILRLAPNGNGISNQVGINAHYTFVDEIPHNGDGDYTGGSSDGTAYALVTLDNAATVGVSGTINAVKSVLIARGAASASSIRVRVRSNSINNDTPDAAIGTVYTFVGPVHASNPSTSAPWTLSELDDLQIGPFFPNGNNTRVTLVSAMVDFSPAAAPVAPTNNWLAFF